MTSITYTINRSPNFLTPEEVDPQDPITRSLGQKQYELSNHLGNVLVTVSDRKLAEGTEGTTATGYKAEVLFASDYYPFGMQMPGREFSAVEYRYGFNGMEKDDEVAGEGNSYTAEFWQYDSRLGRRWNVDPANFENLSNYSVLANNPIIFIDPEGDTFILVGETKEILLFQQMFNNLFNGTAVMSVANNGLVVLEGDRASMSVHQQLYFDHFKQVIEDEEEVQIYLLKESEGYAAIIGGWNGYRLEDGPDKGEYVNSLDIYDLQGISSDDLSPEAFALHEIWETFQGQVNNLDYFEANEKALDAQQEADGIQISSQYRGNDESNKPGSFSGFGYTEYTDADGNKMTFITTIEDKKVVSSETIQGWSSEQ